jgi:site-specific DNA recombinase
MKKAAIYARVSTEKQEKEKTIESQIEELRKFCEKNDFLIVKEYIDDGWSGETLARPALDQLRDDASKKLFDVVCIHSPDRLARKFIYQGLVIEELKKKGVEVIFLNRPISDTPEDQLLLGVQGLIAEYEKAKILERTRRGRIHKAKEKGIVGSVPPYGYNYIKKTREREGYYEINEKEAEVVKLIFYLYLKLQSLHQVKKELYKRGIKTRKGSLIWADSTIQRILTNEAYTGRGYYNRTQSVETETGKKYKKAVKTGRRLRDRKEWIPIRFPKIIDEEKFRLVQELLRKRFKPFGRTKNFYLLSGLVKCARCGYNFCGEGKGGSLSYYRCNNRHRRYPLPKTCNARMIRSRELDNAVWEAVVKAVTNKDILISHIKQLANRLEENEKELEERSRKLKEKLDKISQKKEKLIELYTDGVIGKDEITAKMKNYEKEENEIIKEIAEINVKKEQISLKPKIIENLEKFCKIMKERISSLTQEQKRKFIRYLVEKVVLDSNKRIAKVIGHIPTKVNDELFLQSESGILSMPSWNHEQYPNKYFTFEFEVKFKF